MNQVKTTFYDSYVPSLKAAEYEITVSQTLTGDDKVPTTPHPPVKQRFIIRGPRFRINPGDITRAFPPPNSTGRYHDYLPMMVFNKRSLPWERDLNLSKQVNETQPYWQKLHLSAADDEETYPWVALLVFTEHELPAPGQTSKNNLRNPTSTSTVSLSDLLHPPSGIRGPKLTLEDDEKENIDNIRCNVIDVDNDVFVVLMPSLTDLRYLTHVRKVDTSHKEPRKMVHDGWFSTVIGNRFAVPPANGAAPAQVRNIVHLVSLEGLQDLLGETGAKAPANASKVRLVSLYSWSYTCLPDPKENFRELMLHLITPESEQGTNLLFKLPPSSGATPTTAAQKAAQKRLDDGYVPLPYATRTGEETFAWYRGPLAPTKTERIFRLADVDQPLNEAVPLTASEAMIFDADYGVFDQSYAVAWQTGRSLALASKPFATGLLHWRRQAHALVDLLLERMRSPLLAPIFRADGLMADDFLTERGIEGLAELLQENFIYDGFKGFLAGEFAHDIAQRIGKIGGFDKQSPPPTVVEPPMRTSHVPKDLEKLMKNTAVIELFHHLVGQKGEDGTFPGSQLADHLVQWLAQRALLYDVPFNNLVANTRLLPAETIRFFYIDRNWIDSLLDGALSVGIQSSRDALFHKLTRDPLLRLVDDVLHLVRDRMRGSATEGADGQPKSMAGFLLRSAVVSGWPGLEVRAYSAADDKNPMKPLRLDRVAPNIMLGIFPDVPVKVELSEPSEGLVFGHEDEGIDLRFLPGTSGENAANIGKMMEPKKTLATDKIPHRPATKAIAEPPLIIGGTNGLVRALESTFSNPKPTLGPADFAVQMVRVPEQMIFEVNGGGK
ncbi:MAG: hypothetical protein AAF614_14575 [Chloroflexota bacterium]